MALGYGLSLIHIQMCIRDRGSGTSVQEVNKLIKQLNEMKKMMKMFTSNSKGMKKRGGFPGLPFFK